MQVIFGSLLKEEIEAESYPLDINDEQNFFIALFGKCFNGPE